MTLILLPPLVFIQVEAALLILVIVVFLLGFTLSCLMVLCTDLGVQLLVVVRLRVLKASQSLQFWCSAGGLSSYHTISLLEQYFMR